MSLLLLDEDNQFLFHLNPIPLHRIISINPCTFFILAEMASIFLFSGCRLILKIIFSSFNLKNLIWHSLILLSIIFIAHISFCFAQSKPSITATQISIPPKIDGRLDDGCWQTGNPFSDFIESSPRVGNPATEKTEAIVLFDNNAIYIGARCHMTRDSIWMQLTARDNLLGSTDAFYVGSIPSVKKSRFSSYCTSKAERL